MNSKLKICLCMFLILGTVTVSAGQWRPLGLQPMEISSIETHPSNSQYITAGTNLYGLYVSFDGGLSWSYRLATNVSIPFISYDPVMTDALLALMGNSYSAGLYISTNSGNVWNLINYLLYPRRMGFDPVNQGYFYICFQDGIKKTQDYGQSFMSANTGLPGLNILDVKGDAVNPFEAYAVGETFVAHTTDFGQNWTDMGGMFGLEDYNPSRIEYAPDDPELLYVTCWAYLARSSDGGDTWEYHATPAVDNMAIAFDPDVDGKLYIGSVGGGVYVSTDAGVSFAPFNDSLDNLDIRCLEFDSQGKLLAGTGNGVYYYDFVTDITETDPSMPYRPILHPNYPNPFNATTTITFTITSPQFAALKVYDLLGREVQTLVNEYKESGIYKIDFDAAKFTSGIYFYKLQLDKYVETKRMVLLK